MKRYRIKEVTQKDGELRYVIQKWVCLWWEDVAGFSWNNYSDLDVARREVANYVRLDIEREGREAKRIRYIDA